MPFPYQAPGKATYNKRLETDLRTRSLGSLASSVQP